LAAISGRILFAARAAKPHCIKENSVNYRNWSATNSPNLGSVVLSVLDFLRSGVIVTGIRGEIYWANLTAKEILDAHDGLEVDAEGFMLLSEESRPFPVAGMLPTDAPAASVDDEDRSIKYVHRPFGKRDLTVIARPFVSFRENPDVDKPAALLFIQDPERPVRVLQTDLRQFYGLTLTEGSLANFLMEGSTLEECCERLAIRPSTARMHLRNLLAKTGTRGQGELVWLLFRNHGLMTPTTPPRFDTVDPTTIALCLAQ
jgi:DNA-binding CsgD family transcriptional regulator